MKQAFALRVVRSALNRARYVFMLLGFVMLFGALMFSTAEGKTFFDGIWWAFVTGFTVGYGDLFPVSVPGRLFAMGYMFIMAILWLFVAAHVVSAVIEEKNLFSHEEQESNEAAQLEILKHLGLVPAQYTKLPPPAWWEEQKGFDADEL